MKIRFFLLAVCILGLFLVIYILTNPLEKTVEVYSIKVGDSLGYHISNIEKECGVNFILEDEGLKKKISKKSAKSDMESLLRYKLFHLEKAYDCQITRESWYHRKKIIIRNKVNDTGQP